MNSPLIREISPEGTSVLWTEEEENDLQNTCIFHAGWNTWSESWMVMEDYHDSLTFETLNTILPLSFLLNLSDFVCGQGYPGEKGPRGFRGDDGEPVWKENTLIIYTYNVNNIVH